MACLRATVLTTAVGLMALVTPAFAEVIVTQTVTITKGGRCLPRPANGRTGRDAVADY